MVSNRIRDSLIFHIDCQRCRCLYRHVAIDAVRHRRRRHFRKCRTSRRLMARQAFIRVRRCFALRFVRIVAGRACHAGRRLKTAAPLQQSNLIPMNVYARQRIHLQAHVRSHRVARLVRKWRLQFLADASVALRANIGLPVPLDFERRHLGSGQRASQSLPTIARSLRIRSLVRMRSHMLDTRPVASLARNAEREISFVEVIPGFRSANLLKISRVALQAPRIDPAVKVNRPIHISGAVHPSVEIRPIRNRQFEQLIPAPIQIRLPLGARPDDNVHFLRSCLFVPGCSLQRRFEKCSILSNHSKRHFRIKRRHRVASGVNVPVNRLYRRARRIQVMPRLHIALEFARMAAAASGVADKTARLIRTHHRCRCSGIAHRSCRLGMRLPTRRARKTQRRTDAQECRTCYPPWKPWPQLVPCLSRPVTYNDLLLVRTRTPLASNLYRVRRSAGQTRSSHC
jgi:hypothetical protein